MEKTKVIVAMSGGVDSSLVAAMMVEKGYDVTGVTLKMFDDGDSILEDAEKAAKTLGIKWEYADYSSFFKSSVISYFIKTYKDGKTPNPCCFCNKNAKFKYLFNEMQRLGASRIVTGHYTRVVSNDGINFMPAVAADEKKDQSYYLSLVDNYYLSLCDFPLADYTKDVVRKMAQDAGLHVADKKDSQDVCFLMGGDYRDFLREKLKDKDIRKGNFILDGKILKPHDGIVFYTVGQRKGLGIGHHEPLFVNKIDSITNDIYLAVTKNSDNTVVRLDKCNIFTYEKRVFKAKAKLRYNMKAADCTVEILPDNKIVLLFNEPQASPAPGQVGCIYEGDKVVAGGFITENF